jgi:hypothetical protein
VTSGRITELPALAGRLVELSTHYASIDSRVGYFTALYAVMTARVAHDVAAGRFEDGERMERLACHFASRYLDALQWFEAGQPAPDCWRVSFDAAGRWRPVILQHLLLGMNAHINFDLGIATAEVADAFGLEAVRRDFLEINAVLAELLDVVRQRVSAHSPWMGVLDRVGGVRGHAVINFSMQRARDAAWRVAEDFSRLDAEQRRGAEAALDLRVARFAGVVLKPGRVLTMAAIPVRLRERYAPGEVIAALAAPHPHG